jgi:Spy/CpxP family protein refolding chaperone
MYDAKEKRKIPGAVKRGISSMAFLVALLFVLSPLDLSPAMAYRGSGKMNPEKMVSHLKERLGLDDAQGEAILPILSEQMEKQVEMFQEFRENGEGDRSALRDRMEEIREETESRLSSILTEEQMAAYRKLREERRMKMQGNKRGFARQ